MPDPVPPPFNPWDKFRAADLDWADQAAAAEGRRWHSEVLPKAARVERGRFHPGGPVSLLAYDADGDYLGCISAVDAERARDGYPPVG